MSDSKSDTMTSYRFRKITQYLHMNDDKEMPSRDAADYNALYEVRPALDIIKKIPKVY